MADAQRACSVMIVSGSAKSAESLHGALPKAQFDPVILAGSAGEARRRLSDGSFDIVVINAPLPDEFGTQLAQELGANSDLGVLLLTRGEVYEQVSYRLEDAGVLVLAKPCAAPAVYQAAKLAVSVRRRLEKVAKKTQTLEAKMEEIRLVDRAKWILIQRFQMDEAQAHRTIEKQAMDTRTTRCEIAKNIIRTYEN